MFAVLNFYQYEFKSLAVLCILQMSYSNFPHFHLYLFAKKIYIEN